MERYFTIDDAQHALALVRPIVEDIVKKMEETQQLHDAVKEEKSKESVSEMILLEKLRHAEKLLSEVEYHMKELQSVGVFLKDLKDGLVDFPCICEGRIVYLCWMPGEKEITSWHEIGEGFANRKSVDERFRKVMEPLKNRF